MTIKVINSQYPQRSVWILKELSVYLDIGGSRRKWRKLLKRCSLSIIYLFLDDYITNKTPPTQPERPHKCEMSQESDIAQTMSIHRTHRQIHAGAAPVLKSELTIMLHAGYIPGLEHTACILLGLRKTTGRIWGSVLVLCWDPWISKW